MTSNNPKCGIKPSERSGTHFFLFGAQCGERMAVGIKGNIAGGSGGRGRSFGLMLMLAFGAALFGVMVVHKLRDRRIFNLIVKEKDHQLISLQLLLQKEKESTREERRKIEGLRAKMFSLKSQKAELHSRVMEMQSTIASLKDEHKTLETAFEEKQNEVKLLQDRETDSIIDNPEVIALKEILKQREAEIEDLKHHLEPPVNVWSVSTDDPSNPAVNRTASERMRWKNKTVAGEGEEEQNEHLHETAKDESAGEVKFQKLENAQDDVKGGGLIGERSTSTDQGHENREQSRLEKDNPNATGAIYKGGKTMEEDGTEQVKDDKEHGVTRNGLLEKLENPQGHEDLKLGMISKGGVKLEMPGSLTNGAGSSTGRKHGYAGKTKEKRWRILTKSRGTENDWDPGNSKAANTRMRRISKDKRNKFPSTYTSQQVGEKYEDSTEYGSSEVETHVPDVFIPTSRMNSEAGNIRGSAGELEKEVGDDTERRADGIQQETGTSKFREDEEDAEQAKVTEAAEELAEATGVDTFRNAFENNEEGYKGETDEPEF